MLKDPNVAFLGTETYNTRAHLIFGDADFDESTDTDEIDPHEDIDWRWSLNADFGQDTLSVTHEGSDTDIIEMSPDSQLIFENGISLGGPLSNVIIDDEIIRFPGAAEYDHLEFRASESDYDQILEFERGGNSDYELLLHQNGAPQHVYTEADPVLLEGDEPYIAIENNGAEVHPSPHTVNYGTDLDATADNNTVTVEYAGGTAPAQIHDDGAEALADADGLDFLDYLDVTANTDNNFAEITVNDSDLAVLSAAETVSGDWTFSGNVAFDNEITGSIDHALEADWADEAGQADEANSLSGTALSELAQLDEAETVTGNWTFGANVAVAADSELHFGDSNARFRYSTTSGEFILEDYADGTATAIIEADDSGVEFPEGASVDNDPVATEEWVETSATAFDAARLNGTAESDLDVANAAGWDGFELVVDNETADTNQYIRMETQS